MSQTDLDVGCRTEGSDRTSPPPTRWLSQSDGWRRRRRATAPIAQPWASRVAPFLRSLGGARVRLVAVTIAVLLLAAACGGAGDRAVHQSIPRTARQQLITDRNDPAVVLLQMVYNATVTVPTPGVNQAAVQALDGQLAAEASSGQIGNDANSINDAMVAAISANPGAYFSAGQPMISQPATAGALCTGSIVTPDGYIVTAANCTTMGPGQLHQQYVTERVTPMVDDIVKRFMGEDVSGFDPNQQQELGDVLSTYLTAQVQFSNQTEAIDAAMFGDSSTGSRQGVWEPLLLVAQGIEPEDRSQPSPGDRDFSVVKLDGYDNLPTVRLGSESDLHAGDPLFVDGYAGAGPAWSQRYLHHFSAPTLTAGSLSVRRTSDAGVPLFESTSTISPGDIGGPVFDQDGALIGMISDSQRADNSVSYGLLVGGSVVREVLHKEDIRPRQSVTTTLYDTALNDYYLHYDKTALPEFQRVKALDPSNPYVDRFIQKTQTAISQGRDRTPLLTATEIITLIVTSGVLAALGAAGISSFLIRRRRSLHVTPAAAATGTSSVEADHRSAVRETSQGDAHPGPADPPAAGTNVRDADGMGLKQIRFTQRDRLRVIRQR